MKIERNLKTLLCELILLTTRKLNPQQLISFNIQFANEGAAAEENAPNVGVSIFS